jgi:hypothetical protein
MRGASFMLRVAGGCRLHPGHGRCGARAHDTARARALVRLDAGALSAWRRT